MDAATRMPMVTPRVGWVDALDGEEPTQRRQDVARLLAASICDADEIAEDELTSPDSGVRLRAEAESDRDTVSDPERDTMSGDEAIAPYTARPRSVAIAIATGIANVACVLAVVLLAFFGSSPDSLARTSRWVTFTDAHRALFVSPATATTRRPAVTVIAAKRTLHVQAAKVKPAKTRRD